MMDSLSLEFIVWMVVAAVAGVVFGTLFGLRYRNKMIEMPLMRQLAEGGDANEFAETLIENTPDGFIVVDDEFRIVEVNDAYCRMTGRSRKDLIGHRGPLPGWTPGEVEMMKESMQKVLRGESESFGISYVKKDGGRFPALVSPGGLRTRGGKQYHFALIKDITEQKRAEEELTESESKFRRIVETSTDAIYQLDLDGIITYCSPVVEQILFYTTEEFIGTPFGVHIPPEDLPAAEDAFVRSIGGEEIEKLEIRMLNKNKEPVFIEINATPIRKDGNIVGSQGMARDITERKQAETALRESEAKFKAQYAGLPIPVYTWRQEGEDFVLIDYNTAAHEITEGNIADMLGIGASVFHKDEPDILAEFRQCYRERRPLRREMLYHFKTTGATKHLSVYYAFAPPDLIHVYTEDVTARALAEKKLRESEARFRTAIESVPFDFFVMDDTGRYVAQNSTIAKPYGDIIGKRPEDIGVDADTLAIWQENNRRAFAGEVVEGEVSVKVGGKERSYHNVISPVYDGDAIRGILGVNIDITERKEAEKALRQSEERLGAIISATPNVAIEGYDLEGRVLFWNKAAEAVFGWSSDEAVGKTLDQLMLDKESADGFVETLQEVSRSGQAVGPSEWDFTRKNGEQGTVYSTIFAISFPEGKEEFICMDIDVTARKQAERALKDREEKYRFAIENTGMPFTVWDTEGRLMLINQIGASNLDSTPESLVGKSFHDIFPKEQADEFLARHNDVLRDGVGAQFEDTLDTSRERLWFRSNLQPVKDADGKCFGVQIVSHDITELQQAGRLLRERDERLRLAVGQIPAVLWTVDSDLRFMSSTGAGLAALDLEPGEVVGMTLFEFFGTDDPELLPIASHRKSLAGEPTTYELKWKDVVWETYTEPLRDESDEIIGCLAIALDVTERKRAEEEVRRSREQLRALAGRLHEVREEESASIAREIHDEMGQALTGLKMDLSWIKRRLGRFDDPGQRTELVDKIGAMGREIDESIRAVRKISTQLRPRILDDLGLIGAIEWQTQDFEDRTGVHCEIEQTGLEGKRFDLDSQRSTAVFRIFQEILTNIRRHSGAGQVEIDLRGEDEMLILEVRDDGKGLSPGDVTRLDGLGILGMRERAQVFGGEVSIEGKRGKGTTVRVVIPLGAGP